MGNTYERDKGSTVRKYYYAGGVRVAMRSGAQTYHLLGDHLTSIVITLDSAGNRLNSNTELRYYPYGAARYDTANQQTIHRYTGQRIETSTGLYDYGARWYDPTIGRFLAADTIVPEPGDPQALNRYSYVLNNPVRYTDPTGHLTEDELQVLLGSDYDTLISLWRQYDPYWMAVLEAIQGGGVLQASLLDGIELHFEGSGKGIRLNVYNGSHSKQLWDWQGKGAYRVQNPGMSSADADRFRDQLFNSSENTGVANTVIVPVFDYVRRVNGTVQPTYLGARMIGQRLGEFRWTSTIDELGLSLGLSEGAAGMLNFGAQIGLIFVSPLAEAAVLAVDLTVSVVRTYQSPMEYSDGWPGYMDINPFIESYRLQQ